ncbi:hypothetical protein E1218_33300 [Kribbella turkmenica]|uniref:Uncharacterized protein n=1 Tax=Kribbella turkmenica TaxID=2530375 RepID=A0A4R4WDV0_9ACTN|nr:hypothetical protein [Kribbella turkmenica]TDD14264.1 hypothetical protein E1218_33300 [Kribbella turkmenica]
MSALKHKRAVDQCLRSVHLEAAGTVYDASTLPAPVAEQDGRIQGLLTSTVSDDGLQVISLDALVQHVSIGSALLTAAADHKPKPSIPLTGNYGIPRRDELTLELAI